MHAAASTPVDDPSRAEPVTQLMYIHDHVLQRAVRQVRDASILRLLSGVGTCLGLPQEAHTRRHQELQRRHHLSARARDRTVLSVFSARVEAMRLRRHLLAQVARAHHVRT